MAAGRIDGVDRVPPYLCGVVDLRVFAVVDFDRVARAHRRPRYRERRVENVVRISHLIRELGL